MDCFQSNCRKSLPTTDGRSTPKDSNTNLRETNSAHSSSSLRSRTLQGRSGRGPQHRTKCQTRTASSRPLGRGRWTDLQLVHSRREEHDSSEEGRVSEVQAD